MVEPAPEKANVKPRRGRPRSVGLAERRREELTDAALIVFAEQGYEKASVSEIAKRAGIGQGTLYRYVGGKRELLDLVFDRCAEALLTAISPDDLLRVVSPGDADEGARVMRDLGDRLFRLADERPELLRMVLVQAGTVDEELRFRIQGLYQAFDSMTIRAVSDARERGWLPDRPDRSPEVDGLLGRVLPALAVPGALMSLAGDDHDSRDNYVSAAVTILRRGILSDEARASDSPVRVAG